MILYYFQIQFFFNSSGDKLLFFTGHHCAHAREFNSCGVRKREPSRRVYDLCRARQLGGTPTKVARMTFSVGMVL